MRRKINFAIREMCELRALSIILDYCVRVGIDVFWNIWIFPVNTDLLLFSPNDILKNFKNIQILNITSKNIPVDKKIYGFKANVTHEFDKCVESVVDLYEISTCKKYVAKNKINGLKKPNIIIGSVKIKSPVEDYQVEIWEELSKLPHNIIIVPRHPFTSEELADVRLPKKITLRNTMGELENLYAQAGLTIMGKILGITRLDRNTRDHNPLEATTNSNTVSGIYNDIPSPYLEFYEKSGLVHRLHDWKDIFKNIESLINDPLLSDKLKRREEWIEKNRKKYLPRALEILKIQ